MLRARVAYKDFSCLDFVTSTAIGRAGINGMTVVDAAADRIALNDFDTHYGFGNPGASGNKWLGYLCFGGC